MPMSSPTDQQAQADATDIARNPAIWAFGCPAHARMRISGSASHIKVCIWKNSSKSGEKIFRFKNVNVHAEQRTTPRSWRIPQIIGGGEERGRRGRLWNSARSTYSQDKQKPFQP